MFSERYTVERKAGDYHLGRLFYWNLFIHFLYILAFLTSYVLKLINTKMESWATEGELMKVSILICTPRPTISPYYFPRGHETFLFKTRFSYIQTLFLHVLRHIMSKTSQFVIIEDYTKLILSAFWRFDMKVIFVQYVNWIFR